MKMAKQFTLKSLSLFLTVLVLIGTVSATVPMIADAAVEYTEGEYTYTVSDGNAKIVSFPETSGGDIEIPSKLGGYKVTEIGSYSFYACTTLDSVVIPSTVTTIGNYAFAYCVNLSKVSIPSSVTSIGTNTFKNSNSVAIACEEGSYAYKYAKEKGISTLSEAKSEIIKSEWFKNGAYSGYNQDLARFCADLVLLGYKYNKKSVTEGLERVGLTVESINMEASRDEVNYFIADKNINVNGVNKNLIVIGCIGSYKNQWYSNFDPLGNAREKAYASNSEKNVNHIGFADAKEYVYGKLNEYIKNNSIDKANSIILLTGHSRGSATVNLLGAKLIDSSSSFGVSTNNIYTYGFATPNTTTNKNHSRYSSIINIVNPEDFVTKVMLTRWGYGRYGITYTLPSKTNDNAYETYLNEMRPLFKKYTGELYDPYKKGEVKTYKMVKNFGDEVSNLDDFYTKGFWYSMSFSDWFIYECPYVFFKNTLLKYLVSDDMSGIMDIILYCGPFYLGIITYFAWPDINSSEVMDAITSEKKMLDGVALGGKFKQAHQMETYAAYVHSMTSEQITTNRGAYKGTVNCPVDIEIYDKETGELVGRIVNNVVDEDIAARKNAVVMDVDGDSKSYWLPSNGNYEVKLIGNDEGTMDCTMSEINSDIGELKRVNFFDVEITDGLTMKADIEAEEFVIKDYELVYNNGETLEPDEILDEVEIPVYNIEVSITEGGIASSSQTAKSGDYVSLEAQAKEGWKLIGWYENNELISTKTTLSFVAKNDRKLEARFEYAEMVKILIKTPSTSTINYGDTLILHADLGESALPAGYSIEWTAEGNGFKLEPAEDGMTCNVTSVQNGKVTVTATLVDADGNPVLDADGNEISASQELNSKVTFWQKIVSFFKNIFRIPRIILQSK